ARTLPITPEHTAAVLHDDLALLGAQAIVEALRGLEAGSLTRTKQDAALATYAAKLEKSEAPLDFTLPARRLARRVRAFNPVPGATVTLPGLDAPVKVWKATALPQPAQGRPGELQSASADGIDMATGDGARRPPGAQPTGRRATPCALRARGVQCCRTPVS